MSDEGLVEAIRNNGWWQGSVISAAELSSYLELPEGIEFLVVASQTCNLYNFSLTNIPVFELVGAKRLDNCNNAYTKGDHPRILHLESITQDQETILLEVNILQRYWLDRRILASTSPIASIRDSCDLHDPDIMKKQWLDKFSGWLARSYTRVTLPDEFNTALEKGRLKKYINSKLTADADSLHGIYFNISHDSEDPYDGSLGLMPPPYLLEITVVTNSGVSSESLETRMKQELFERKKNGDQEPLPSIADTCLAQGITISELGIIGRTTDDLTLGELSNLTRYSMVDHLSDSKFSSPE
ncbi:hypothetical protein [Pseudomonas nitroreducens]|uniref:hypothetical protein n=1 Tax=Pseudomonas nitroreducens TaxID=46680 RepID=UPI000B6EDDAB|nr:hypothetical protein [Pseudomonas nitroreducens]NMZ58176.1 hypothetical protein [Pseudomonas nitroreducens]SNS12520.1 hypothetical protein SAMN05216209_1402 [Pseudomonas nitroreducens]